MQAPATRLTVGGGGANRGADYRYLLFFERGAHLDALEGLAAIAVHDPDDETILVRGDRIVTLPFAAWAETESRNSADDPSPTWDFMTVLCFEPDDAIEDYVDRLRARFGGERGPDDYDARGRAAIGIIYLTVHNDMTEWPSGAREDLVLLEFHTPGSTMSRLFTASESIRRAFTHLLESFRGVYGVLDREEWAELFWWRGEEMAAELNVADLPLAEIERLVGLHR